MTKYTFQKLMFVSFCIVFSIVLILCLENTGHTTSWFACSSSANINKTNEWSSTPSGASCACTAGAYLTWGAQASGDYFYANGCTLLAINVDPGPNGQVTLSNEQSGSGVVGGGFTYATSVNLNPAHAAFRQGGSSTTITTSGNTGGGTFTGGCVEVGSSWCFSGTHTSVNVTLQGNADASGGTSYAAQFTGTTGSLTVGGICIAGTHFGCILNSGNAMTVGGCQGSSSTANVYGCGWTGGSGTITIIGPLINTAKSAAISGGPFVWNPMNNQQYISVPGPSSTTIYTSQPIPVAEVLSGYTYGYNGSTYLTGTATSVTSCNTSGAY